MNWRRGFNRLALVFGAIGVAGGFYVGTLQDDVIAEKQAHAIREWKRTEIRLKPEVIATVREALIKANLGPDNPGQLLKSPSPPPAQASPQKQGSGADIFGFAPNRQAGGSSGDADIFGPPKGYLEHRRDQIESQIIEPLVPPLAVPSRDLARWLEILKLTAIFGLVGWLPFRLMGWIVAGFAR